MVAIVPKIGILTSNGNPLREPFSVVSKTDDLIFNKDLKVPKTVFYMLFFHHFS